MTTPTARLRELQIELPPVPPPAGNYVHAVPTGNLLFLAGKGRFTLRFRDGSAVTLDPGELFVVPRGVEHQPVVEEEAQVLVFEPKATRHTGDVKCEQTVEKLEWL